MKEFLNKLIEIIQNPVISNVVTTILIPVLCVAMKIFNNVSVKSNSNDKSIKELKTTITEMEKQMKDYQNVLNKNTALELTVVELVQTAFVNSKLDNQSKQRIIEIATTAKGLVHESAPKVKDAIQKSVEAIESVSDGVKELINTVQETKNKTYIERLEEEVNSYEETLQSEVSAYEKE